MTPTDLRCEDLVDPLGIDVVDPRLSWRFSAADPDRRGLRQRAYQVVVATRRAALEAGQADLWDSGLVPSGDMRHVAYAGRPLRSREHAWWSVRVERSDGTVSDWSPPARWTMGLLQPDDWTARWVGLDEADRPADLPARYLRREFDIAAAPVTATLYVSGLRSTRSSSTAGP